MKITDRRGTREIAQEEEVELRNGRPNVKFLEKHNLNQFSEAQEWLSAFLPSQQPAGKEDKWHLGHITTFTNLKAELMNAGQKDGIYPDFVKFTTDEIEKYIFLYVFQGISPSPRVEMKFKTQEVDGVNGNDFIAHHFTNGSQRHKQFKCFYLFKTHAFILLLKGLIQIFNSIHFPNMHRKYRWKLGCLV